MKLTLAVGLALTALATALMVLLWGWNALVPGVVFGLIATALQAGATTLARAAIDRPVTDFARKWAVGMGLRFAGIVLFGLGVALWPEAFPPLPSAFGFLGVIVPLLFLEIRLTR